MDDEQRHGVASDAKPATVASPPQNISALEPNDTNASGVASDATLTALDDGIKHTLTAEQALSAIAGAGRKVPSLRSLQRHCDEGLLRAIKIKTTYGQEWLINEASLAQYIVRQPRIEIGVAGDANETPSPFSSLKLERDSNAIGDASVAGDAKSRMPPLNHAGLQPNDTNASGDAGDAKPLPLFVPTGERRTIAEVLIENAKLFAQNEGKDDIIVELKDDRAFLREEVREARSQRNDIKTIAEKMLTTFQNIALRGLIAAPPETDSKATPATVIKSEPDFES